MREQYGANSTVAIRTHKTSILAQRLTGSFLPEGASSIPAPLGRGPTITAHRGAEYNFSGEIYPAVELFTIKAPERSKSMLKEIIITRRAPGPIGLVGTLKFNKDFGGALQCKESKTASRLGFTSHERDFLISGGDLVEVVLYPPKGSKRKKK